MDEVLQRGAEQAPGLAVLAVVVFMFLRAHTKFSEIVRETGSKCHETQLSTTKMTTEAIDRNTMVLGEATRMRAAIDRNTQVLSELKTVIDRCGRVEKSIG